MIQHGGHSRPLWRRCKTALIATATGGLLAICLCDVAERPVLLRNLYADADAAARRQAQNRVLHVRISITPISAGEQAVSNAELELDQPAMAAAAYLLIGLLRRGS